MVDFSFIVPVYNVSDYLKECIDSILKQTYENFEVILINDGSTDNSGSICEEYFLKDKRIKYVIKHNGGLSSARNLGLSISEGAYIIFLDSDDFWIDKTALKNIYNNLLESKADLLVFQANKYYEDKQKFVPLINIEINRNFINHLNHVEKMKYLLQKNIYRAAAWNKVIKKSIIDNNGMLFKEGYLSEDMDWCGDLLLYCNQIDIYEKPVYAYRQQRKGSITSSKKEKLIHDKVYMCKKGYLQATNNEDNEIRNILLSYYAYEYCVALGVSFNVKDVATKKELESLRVLLNYNLCNKVKLVKKLERLLGYKLTRLVLCLFVCIKN